MNVPPPPAHSHAPQPAPYPTPPHPVTGPALHPSSGSALGRVAPGQSSRAVHGPQDSGGAVGTVGLVAHSQLSHQQASNGGPVGSVPFATGGSDGTGSAAAAVGTGIFRVDVIPAAPSPSHTISKLGYRHSGVADMPVSGGAGSSEGYVALHGQEGAVGNGRHLGPEHGGGGQRWAMARQPHLHLMTSSPGGTGSPRSRTGVGSSSRSALAGVGASRGGSLVGSRIRGKDMPNTLTRVSRSMTPLGHRLTQGSASTARVPPAAVDPWRLGFGE